MHEHPKTLHPFRAESVSTRFQKFAHVLRATHAEMALRRRRSGSFPVRHPGRISRRPWVQRLWFGDLPGDPGGRAAPHYHRRAFHSQSCEVTTKYSVSSWRNQQANVSTTSTVCRRPRGCKVRRKAANAFWINRKAEDSPRCVTILEARLASQVRGHFAEP